MRPYIHSNTIDNSQDMETAWMSLRNEWMKTWHTHTTGQSSVTENETMPHRSNTNGPGNYHTKQGKPEKDKALPVSSG